MIFFKWLPNWKVYVCIFDTLSLCNLKYVQIINHTIVRKFFKLWLILLIFKFLIIIQTFIRSYWNCKFNDLQMIFFDNLSHYCEKFFKWWLILLIFKFLVFIQTFIRSYWSYKFYDLQMIFFVNLHKTTTKKKKSFEGRIHRRVRCSLSRHFRPLSFLSSPYKYVWHP